MVGGVPGAYFLWYSRLYNSSIKDSAFGYSLFFAGYFAHLVFCIWSTVGAWGGGAAALRRWRWEAGASVGAGRGRFCERRSPGALPTPGDPAPTKPAPSASLHPAPHTSPAPPTPPPLLRAAAAPPFLAGKSHTGYMSAISRIGANTGVGVIYFMGAAFWTLESAWSVFVMKGVYRSFRGNGMTAAQVQREAAGRVAMASV